MQTALTETDAVLNTREGQMRLAAVMMMASPLSVEISQPLTSAANYINACRRKLSLGGEANEGLSHLLELAGGDTLRAGEMIRTIRRFVGTGRLPVRRENLLDIVQRVSQSLVSPDGVAVQVVRAIPQNAALVMVDRMTVEQVISAILANAALAMNGRRLRRITITATRLGPRVELRIRDCGPGLPRERLAGLFEFRPLPDAHRPRLCLPICRLVVEAQGGGLIADSPTGGGLSLRMSLHAADE